MPRSAASGAWTALVCSLLLAAPAWGANGHFVHGVGSVSSSMGGAGVAVDDSALAALYLNPALLAAFEGHELEFNIELVEADPSVESTVQTPFGPFTGRTEDEADLSVLPSFGWVRGTRDGGRLAFGMGALALAGFGTDYPQDPANPVLAPQPQGMGAVFSSYKLMRLPFAVAWQVTPELALGASINGGYATLAATPFGGAPPDCSGPTTCYFPSLQEDSAFGVGAQVGVLWRPSAAWSFGASYASETRFEEFAWNTTVANPNLPSFGTARQARFRLDAPASAVVGLAWRPDDRLTVALDGRWIGFDGTEGFEGGFDPATGAGRGLGWEDIVVVALGAEYQVTPRLAVRAGWNQAEQAIPPESAFANVSSPALFEDHLTLGLGFRAYEALELNLGYWHAFDSEVTGPIPSPAGPVPGASVTHVMSADAVLATFSFSL